MRHSSDHSRLANVAEVTPLNRRPPYRGTMGNLDFWRRFLAPIVFVAALLLVLGVLALRDIRAGDQFDVVRWERTTLANKWLHALGEPFRDDFDDDEALRRYFTLGDRGGDEARELESAVEAAIEGRIDRVLADLGVDGRFPLPASVFPPVDIEIAGSPRVLVISPRSRIERVSSDLLRPDLTQDDFEAIEREAEEDESFAALVVGTGGVATYPAVVAEGRSYRQTLETAAHEWVHHYLVFYPLGRNFYDSSDLQTINETVADVVGDEVAAIILERWGDPTVRPRPTPTTSAPTPEPEVQTSPSRRRSIATRSCANSASRSTTCWPRVASNRRKRGWRRCAANSATAGSVCGGSTRRTSRGSGPTQRAPTPPIRSALRSSSCGN